MKRSPSLPLHPPSTNRGVQNTPLEGLIDWCSFTVSEEFGLWSVLDMMSMEEDDFIEMPKGGLGYKTMKRNGNISIFTDGKEGMGIHVQMTGQGCREFETCFRKDLFFDHSRLWKQLISRVFTVGGHFTRLDVALDDRKGFFSLDVAQDKMRRREVRTRFKKGSSTESYKFSDQPAQDGKTIYFGSPKSNIKVRIYDKAAQKGVDGVWIRTELECRDNRANVLAHHLMGSKELGAIAAGVLKNYVAFVEPSGDSNKSRWSVTPWWSNFLGEIERIKLSGQKVERTIEQVKDWVKKQVAPSLALLFKHWSGDYDEFEKLILQGERRLTPRHIAMLSV